MNYAAKANRHVKEVLEARLEYHKNHPKLANHLSKESIEEIAKLEPGFVEAYLHAYCVKEIGKLKKKLLPHLAVYALQEEQRT
tara:strand:+ start:426 stop:674 length:249 start_codon:yes stop_codon:yes gene_type:complete